MYKRHEEGIAFVTFIASVSRNSRYGSDSIPQISTRPLHHGENTPPVLLAGCRCSKARSALVEETDSSVVTFACGDALTICSTCENHVVRCEFIQMLTDQTVHPGCDRRIVSFSGDMVPILIWRSSAISTNVSIEFVVRNRPSPSRQLGYHIVAWRRASRLNTLHEGHVSRGD